MRNQFGDIENGLASLLVYVTIDARQDATSKTRERENSAGGSKDLSTMIAEFSTLERKKKSKNKVIDKYSQKKY